MMSLIPTWDPSAITSYSYPHHNNPVAAYNRVYQSPGTTLAPNTVIDDNLGYCFSERALIERALTRRAYANEQRQRGNACDDQEILCTLGDAVLKTVLVKELIRGGADTPEIITRRKIGLEREENLAAIAGTLGIGPFIRLGKGEEKNRADEQPYVLAETLEAVIGAMFLDGGYEPAEERIRAWFSGLI